MRVVTTTCSNTEIVCALGCAELLVGVDDHSDFPPEVVERLPRVGPDLGIDPAKVAALEPDLVIASYTVPGHEQVVASLRAAGLRVEAPEPVCIDHVYRDVRAIAGWLGVAERGERLIAAMRAELDPPARARRIPHARRPRILVEWWPKPVIVPGRLSWVTELIERAGGTNPWGHEAMKSRPVRDDEVREARPDAVVIAWCGVRAEKYRPAVVARRAGWAGLAALERGRIYCVSEAYLGRPSPRLLDGFRALSAIVAEIADDSPA